MDPASAIDTSKDTRRVQHSDATLIDMIARAVRAALQRGDAVVWIGTETSLRWLEARLSDLSVDITDARINRRVLCIDAAQTLTEITVEGLPDIVRFAEVVGAQIDMIANRHAGLAIFFESATSGVSAFEALLKSFAQSRAMFSYSVFHTPACRC